MENDRKLLELAAKAAGIVHEGFDEDEGREVWWLPDLSRYDSWNPLDDDGDALRLAVKLDIKLVPYPLYATPKHSIMASRLCLASEDDDENTWIGPDVFEPLGEDHSAAWRRAIVRAAAENGRAME